MAWEEELFAYLDDLEGQAEAMWAAERHGELQERARAEYAVVTLASRLHASLEHEVALEVTGIGRVAGILERVGAGWCLVAGAGQDWIVRLAALAVVEGASERSVPDAALSPVTRLGLGSVLRRVAESGERCVLRLLDGTSRDVLVQRVGADFVEVTEGERRTVLVAFEQVAALQRRPD